jgi:prepilin-type N-terminal cleavage/methylation domain-containing protein
MRSHRGFSLLELMVVVAIVAMVMMMVIPSFNRASDSGRVDTAVRILRGKVEHVRVLASEVGPHIGDPNAGGACPPSPACWNYTNCAPGLVPGYLWVRIDNVGNYWIPNTVTVDPISGAVNVVCEQGTINGLMALTTQAPPALNYLYPTATLDFSFAGTGRVVYSPPPAAPSDLFFQLQNQSDTRRYGFRIFPSGVLCNASVGTVPTQCDSE